ncbi:MAG TPA: hypothetical protein PLQ64_11930 [Thiobacillaceae bacterium]|nr:hypothetical protein [Thiobacillaceae bacterium]HNA83175.1 hypothetical protein [Thiobacillaceae bacterium]HNI08093.1 hypothetical protein [Thiobacillaceae bacterium]
MKRTASLLLVAITSVVHAAGFENMLNPLGGLNPFGTSNPFAPNPFAGTPFGYGASPLGMASSPFGYGSPLGLGSPFGLGSPLGLGAVVAPLGLGLLGSPLGGGMGNAMYPALQVAPNMMSYQHLNQMANPYGGGPFAGNPYLQPSMPNPFAAPAFSPSMPTLPTMPFAAPQQQGALGGVLPLPQQGMIPYGLAFPMAMPAPSTSVVPAQTPWSGAAVPAQQPSANLFSGFPGFPTAPAPVLVPAPAPVPAAPAPLAPQSLLPFLPMQAAPAAAPAQAASASVKTPAASPDKAATPQAPASTLPMDPASFMQMLMKPAEPAK